MLRRTAASATASRARARLSPRASGSAHAHSAPGAEGTSEQVCCPGPSAGPSSVAPRCPPPPCARHALPMPPPLSTSSSSSLRARAAASVRPACLWTHSKLGGAAQVPEPRLFPRRRTRTPPWWAAVLTLKGDWEQKCTCANSSHSVPRGWGWGGIAERYSPLRFDQFSTDSTPLPITASCRNFRVGKTPSSFRTL